MLAQQLRYDPAFTQPAFLAIAFELLAQVRGQSDSKCHDEMKVKMSLYYIITLFAQARQACMAHPVGTCVYIVPVFEYNVVTF